MGVGDERVGVWRRVPVRAMVRWLGTGVQCNLVLLVCPCAASYTYTGLLCVCLRGVFCCVCARTVSLPMRACPACALIREREHLFQAPRQDVVVRLSRAPIVIGIKS